MAVTKRISLTQLSEYLTASPSRRKSIIEDAADPKPFIAKTYNAASDAIAADIMKGGTGSGPVLAAIEALKGKVSAGLPDWQVQHVLSCIEALEKYLQAKETFGLSAWSIKPPDVGPGSMMISGVRVGISPEAILTKEVGNAIHIGAVKFYFSKSKPLGKKRAEYIGALMDWYCEKHLKSVGIANYRCSLVADVPGNALYEAPKAKVRNRQDIEAACEEIADRWP